MDRNTITGLVLIFILWMGLMFFTNKQKEVIDRGAMGGGGQQKSETQKLIDKKWGLS